MNIKPSIRRNPWRLSALAVVMLCCAGAVVVAAPLEVNNHSFESASYTGANSWTNNLQDTDDGTTVEWDGRDGNNSGQAFIERIGGFFSHGLAHIGMETTYYVFQDTGLAWEPNSRYTLTVGIGNRNASFTVAGNNSVIGLTNTIPVFATAADAVAGDALLAEAHTAFNASTIPVSTFRDQQVQYDTGATPPEGSIIILLGSAGLNRSHFDNVRLDVVGLQDQDGDGLPTTWETANGLNPESSSGNDGAGGDPDDDGSTNLQEFQRGTNPQNPDTDADGAKDGWETGTGILVSSTDLGTNPRLPDTDGDTLLDGAEAGAAQPTDPNKADTDGDQFEDQAEIAAGTNPSVGGENSVPTASGDVVVGLNFVGGRVDGTLGASPTGPAGVVPQTNWNNLPDLAGNGFALVSSTNTPQIMRASWTVDDTFTIETPSSPADPNSALMQGFLRTRQGVPTRVTVRNIPYPTYDVYVYADSESTVTTGSYSVNGNTLTGVRDTTNWPVSEGGGVFQQIPSSGAEGNYMVFRNVSGPTMTLTASDTTTNGTFGAPINAVQIVRATGDGDGDGMPDLWEDANGLNKNDATDGGLDPDSDGSTNLNEFQRSTDPRNPDTDGDGLKDGVETKTGTFVSPTNTGTDPLKADTDGDGLSDGVESGTGTFVSNENTGTDPNKPDTDGDSYTDGEEIAFGGNPVLASSIPSLPTPLGYWPFNDQGTVTTADASGSGNEGTVVGNVTYVEGSSGQAGDFAASFDGVDAAITTPGPLLDAVEAFTMAGWVNFTASQANRTGFFGQNDAVEFGMIDLDTIELWTPTGGAIQVGFGPATDGWQHVAVVADATGRRIYIDGQEVVSGGVGTPTATTGFTFNIGGGGIQDGTGNFFNGQLDDVALWNVALPASFIRRLADREMTPGGPPPSQSFEISGVSYNPANQTVTITFPTIPGQRYIVFRSDGSSGVQWVEADDFVATGEEGVHNSVLPGNVSTRLFRVRRSPN